MPPPWMTIVLASTSVFALALFYLAAQDIADNLSPQGCRMSWMSPSYVPQTDFNTSWTPLARRYSLSLYREVGWETNQLQGTPVLFIPGNAGSSHQVRSIASSATRQFYTSPHVVAPEFSGHAMKPLDFFAAEFNEDLSAFHGPTLESQITYTSHAISYILSLYPPNTSIIIMGHSMGGIVATSLLPSSNISAIITMSTPHTLPPARFDSRIDRIYAKTRKVVSTDTTPILSLCGGATDMMIPSESCILPAAMNGTYFRRTVFTSALEGAWTGVGHREMVWCHQVRWRIARAALELATRSSENAAGEILDKWLRDGHKLPTATPKPKASFKLTDNNTYRDIPIAQHLVLPRYKGSFTYLLPLPPAKQLTKTAFKAVVLVGWGSIPPVGPHHAHALRVSAHMCSITLNEEVPVCSSLNPTVLKLIPYQKPGMPFPVAGEGADESEGTVVFEADLVPVEGADKQWLGIRAEDGDGNGWVVGGIALKENIIEGPNMFSVLFGSVDVLWSDKTALRSNFVFPNLVSSALIVYKYTPIRPKEQRWCSDPILPPMISHTSHPAETHYFPVNSHNRRTLLHSHALAPYIASTQGAPRTPLQLVIYSSGTIGCNMLGFSISIDWLATLGRWGSRYPTTLVSWTVGVVSVILFTAWGATDRGAAMPSVEDSLSNYSRRTLKKLLFASLLAAVLPFPANYYLGTGGEFIFAPIAPILLLIASGMACVSWWALKMLMWPIGALGSLIFGRFRVRENTAVRRSTIASMALIFVLIFLFVPWQVAYLGCWFIQLFNCAHSANQTSGLKSSSSGAVISIPLIRIADADGNLQENSSLDEHDHEVRLAPFKKITMDNQNHNMHLLLLMTWLLPFVAPVLAVWVRTLVTAGLTTPFDGDHDFLNVAPFLILVDFASWNTGILFERQKFENALSVRWTFAVVASTAFFIGPTRTYSVFDAAKIAIGIVVMIRVGRRYWGGEAWSYN